MRRPRPTGQQGLWKDSLLGFDRHESNFNRRLSRGNRKLRSKDGLETLTVYIGVIPQPFDPQADVLTRGLPGDRPSNYYFPEGLIGGSEYDILII
ncbi:unnamed protein product [Nesidiocoris tenuis]|uniref:Uncharacterized protein n=1 Tax=Nesidiocoris tenuis TaxID=355587 RepID=A0A6H5H2C3_9HEMI|nr:unnamed protein product [Nesidiocoris tenuis]